MSRTCATCVRERNSTWRKWTSWECGPRRSARGSLRFYSELGLNLFSPYPLSIDRNYDPALRERARALAAENRYDLAICDCAQMVRHVAGLDVPVKVLFQHNVEAQILQRHAEHSKGWLRSRYMKMQWQRMRRFEAECGHHFDAVIAVSEPD